MTRIRQWALRLGAPALVLAAVACSADQSITGPAGAPQLDLVSSTGGASLISCPTSDTRSVTKVIGPKGGTIALAGSKMVVPRGAVAQPTRFTLTLPASPWMKVDISAEGVSHYQFRSPVQVTVGYARCGDIVRSESSLSAWYVEEGTDAPLENMNGVDTKRHKAVVFETDHLSGYAISW